MSIVLRITDAGRAALVNAARDGTNAVRIASVGVTPTAIVAAANTAALPGEVKRIASISGAGVAADVIHLVVRDESADTYTVRSLALYLTDGTLFASYGQAAPIIEKSAGALLLLAIDATLLDVAASQITFGNTNFLNPPATTETPGVVELATDAEATALADALRALSPKNMAAIFTAANILSRLLQADGAGSGLDADLLDGRQAAEFALLAGATFAGALNAPSLAVTGANGARVAAASPLFSFYNAAQTDRLGYLQHSGASGDLEIVNDQGGLVKITTGGSTTLLVGPSGANVVTSMAVQGATPNFEFYSVNRATRFGYLTHSGAGGTLSVINDQGGTIALNTGGKNVLTVGPAGATVAGVFAVTGVISSNGSAVWHAANDGAGSGLDADLLDGRQAAEFALLTSADFTGPVSTTRVTATGSEGFRAAAASPLLSFFNAAQSTRFGYVQHAGTNGALSIVNEQGAPINLTTGGKNVVVVGPSGAYIDGVLAQAGAGKYLHHADGNIAGDTITRGTAAPAGGRDGDMHLEANVAAGTMRVWHNYAGTWLHT